jgi:hypothetical protein
MEQPRLMEFDERPLNRRALPRHLVEDACEIYGRDLVVAWCEGLLAGTVDVASANHPDISWLGGTTGWKDYWGRTWGARGLVYCGPPRHPDIVIAALDDEHPRVRAMAARVMRVWAQ